MNTYEYSELIGDEYMNLISEDSESDELKFKKSSVCVVEILNYINVLVEKKEVITIKTINKFEISEINLLKHEEQIVKHIKEKCDLLKKYNIFVSQNNSKVARLLNKLLYNIDRSISKETKRQKYARYIRGENEGKEKVVGQNKVVGEEKEKKEKGKEKKKEKKEKSVEQRKDKKKVNILTQMKINNEKLAKDIKNSDSFYIIKFLKT